MNQAKWQTLSFAQQMGNIGSEVARASHWDDKNDQHNRNSALERAFDLIDLTLSDTRWKGRLKEMTRMREVLADWFTNQNFYHISPQDIVRYCIQFSLIPKN